VLAKWFLFPQVPGDLPRRLSNKKELHFLCRNFAIACPDNTFPRSVNDVYSLIEHARFPIVVKAAESQRLPAGTRSVSVRGIQWSCWPSTSRPKTRVYPI